MTSTEFNLLREAILTVLDDGRRIGIKSRSPWYFYHGDPDSVGDWQKDTPATNQDRADFCDAVQSHLIKSIQRAEDENALICPECSGRNGHKTPFCGELKRLEVVQ